MTTTVQRLVDVFCGNPLCPYTLRRGGKRLVGRISGRAELSCPACRTVALYEV